MRRWTTDFFLNDVSAALWAKHTPWRGLETRPLWCLVNKIISFFLCLSLFCVVVLTVRYFPPPSHPTLCLRLPSSQLQVSHRRVDSDEQVFIFYFFPSNLSASGGAEPEILNEFRRKARTPQAWNKPLLVSPCARLNVWTPSCFLLLPARKRNWRHIASLMAALLKKK